MRVLVVSLQGKTLTAFSALSTSKKRRTVPLAMPRTMDDSVSSFRSTSAGS